jgi:hypothetical protein
MGGLSRPAPPISPKPGCYAGGGGVSKSPEEDLEQFLAPLSALMKMVLQYDYSSLDDPSISQEEKLEWIKNQDKEAELRPKYEAILQRNPVEWTEYCRRAKQIDKLMARQYRIAPRGKLGRKPQTELAERIWKLDVEGRTNSEIQQILNAEGKSLSLGAIESYLKTRRRKPEE